VTRKTNGKRHAVRIKQMKCTGRLVSGTVSFTTTAGTRDQATISRGDVVYAAGASVAIGQGRFVLFLSELQPLHRGSYTLTVRRHRRGGLTIRRATVTIRGFS
jgi:hypothetical protein